MGDWGYKPYQTDEAADWYAVTLQKFDFKRVETAILNFNSTDENCYEPLRCAAFLLQNLGIPHIWYVKDGQADPKELIQKAIVILENMASIDNEAWTYLDMWGHDLETDKETGIVAALKEQVAALEERLKDWESSSCP